jgi:hypothetical protein
MMGKILEKKIAKEKRLRHTVLIEQERIDLK